MYEVPLLLIFGSRVLPIIEGYRDDAADTPAPHSGMSVTNFGYTDGFRRRLTRTLVNFNLNSWCSGKGSNRLTPAYRLVVSQFETIYPVRFFQSRPSGKSTIPARPLDWPCRFAMCQNK